MSETLCIRADAGPEMGIGHVMRCIALAQAWQDGGGRVIFITATETPAILERLTAEGLETRRLSAPKATEADSAETRLIAGECGAKWLILDGYHFPTSYHRSVKSTGLKLLIVDDIADSDLSEADAILNQNIYAAPPMYAGATHAELLLGLNYTLLRREILQHRHRRTGIAAIAKNVLVTLGGSDPPNATLEVMQALAACSYPNFDIKIVVGAANPHWATLESALPQLQVHHQAVLLRNPPHLPELMADADLAIAASGSSSWELACLGAPMLLIMIAANQAGVVKRLAELQVATDLGPDRSQWPALISTTAHSHTRRDSMSRSAAQLLDGRGASRVVKYLRGH